MFKSLLTIATLGFLNSALAATSWGKCDEVQLKADFDSSLYVGRWYEIQRGDLFQDDDQTCVTADYALQSDGSISVKNRSIRPSRGQGGIDGTATCRGS